MVKFAVLQRVCPGYRLALYRGLAGLPQLDFKLFMGEDIPNSKVRSAANVEGFAVEKLKTVFLKLGKRVLPWHLGLISRLKEFQPDVILCEGESHFLGYVQAILYKLLFGKEVKLLHWCFISLPGQDVHHRNFRFYVKRFFRRFFSGFLLYSSFSADRLRELGVKDERIFVAVNVGDTEKFLSLADSTLESQVQARERLNLPQRFTVLFIGSLEAVKKPEMFLELAQRLPQSQYNFVLLGGGAQLEELREKALLHNLTNVFLPGNVHDLLGVYSRAADVVFVPGRGGIVLSEGLALGLPVVVHQADGTEYDLILPEQTGVRLSRGDVEHAAQALDSLRCNPARAVAMGKAGRELIRKEFSTQNMVRSIFAAVQAVMKQTTIKQDSL